MTNEQNGTQGTMELILGSLQIRYLWEYAHYTGQRVA